MSPFAIVGFAALAVVVVGWLVVSFSAPGTWRVVVEWTAATALYVVFVSLFGHLAWEAESRAGLVAFGFLGLLFAAGGLVSFINALLSLRGPGRGQRSATS